MSDRLEYRVGDLVGLDGPCDHLSREELEDLVEGRLDPGRFRDLETHAAGCAACTELLSDLDRFRDLLFSGLAVATERRAFEATDPEVRRKLGLLRPPRRWFRPMLFWLTPAMAVLVLALIWLWPTEPVLIARIEPVPLQPPPAVRGLTLSETWSGLEEPWAAGDMARASVLLQAAVEQHPGQPDLLFYLGLARLLGGDATGALAALQEADRIEADFPSEQTRWMLAAALERVGRRDEACATLRSVAEIGGGRSVQAREIVERSCR